VVGADVLALPVLADADGVVLGPGAAELLERFDVDLFGLLDRGGASGKPGEIVEMVLTDGPSGDGASTLLLLVGVGACEPVDLRRAGAGLARRARGMGTVATSLAAVGDDTGLRAAIEGLVLGSFGFSRHSTPSPSTAVESVVLAGLGDLDARQPALDRALALADAAWLSRTLALVPSNEKDPEWLAARAVEVAQSAGLDVTVWDETRLAAEGFGGIVGVGQESVSPPRLVQLAYRPETSGGAAQPGSPEGEAEAHVVLVGKGITFDTGGLSLKPAEAMANMKRDMSGAGVVLAVMGALGDLGCSVRVTGLLPLAENAVGGGALRPGDVVRHYGGRTSEVSNTDAEGRLVLADAMAYAVTQLAPTVLVDVATLTGAMKVALGQRTGGFFANDDALAGLLDAAGLAAGEPLWRMPLVDDYEELIESSVADADNSSSGPGAVTAALFLRHFAGSVPWAHLDLASVGDSPVDAYEWSLGATGFGARALLHWLELSDPLAGVPTPAQPPGF
jgi:leucyl aminopeptidase